MGVGGDFLIDFQSKGQSGAAGGGVDARLRSGGYGVEEVFELEAEWLGVGEIELL